MGISEAFDSADRPINSQKAETDDEPMFDRNCALEAYSAPFGNDTKRLEAYCQEVGFSGDITLLAESFKSIQEQAFHELWRRSEARPLTQDEMIAVTREYVAKHEPWMNETGINGLLQYIAWLSHHEGCVKFLESPRRSSP